MANKDIIMKAFMSDPSVFADAFNYYLYQGKKVIDPKRLKELDPSEITFINSKNRKQRDVLKAISSWKSDGKCIYCLLGIENQTYVHYAGPFVSLRYDYLRLEKQVRDIQEAHVKAKDLKGDEFLSQFSKEDKLIPVITLYIYFSDKKWDGPRYLHEMYVDVKDEEMKQKMLDYELNLIEPCAMGTDAFQLFKTELKYVLEFCIYTSNKEKMYAFVQNELERNIDVKTARVINVLGNVGLEIAEEKVEVNMCKAMDELKQDWKDEGALSSLLTSVQTVMKKMNLSSEDAMSFLEVSPDKKEALMKML